MERHHQNITLGRYHRRNERIWYNPKPPHLLKPRERRLRTRVSYSYAPVTVSPTDRLRHMWLLGKSGSGKSTLLHNLILQDIYAGRGCALIDPHGDLSSELLHYIPPSRRRDVIYFNPQDLDYPIGLNVLERVHPDQRPRVADGVLSTFRDIWADSWGPALHELLEHALLAMLDVPGGNLVAVKYLITSDDYRQQVIPHIRDPIIRDYWQQDWSALPERLRRERSLSTLNKLRRFITDPMIRNIVGQQRSAIDFRRVMDDGQIFIANLDKGQLGREKSQLLGALLVAKFYGAAITRPKHADLPPYILSIDEFQSFSTNAFSHILSEARGYGLGLTVAHQYLAQLDDELLSALKGNVSTTVCFATGADDAPDMARSLGLDDNSELIDGPPFTARIRAPNGNKNFDIAADMQKKFGKRFAKAAAASVLRTREKFGTQRAIADEEIAAMLPEG